MSEVQNRATASAKPLCRHEDALAVVTELRRAGHVACFAGGCVRDLLLGQEPKDWDVATDAPPGRVRQLFRRSQAVGQAFGVILVKQGPSTIQVATFRSDSTYSDGRRPDAVAFTNAKEDARRRDFTINGLFLFPPDDAAPAIPPGAVSTSTSHGMVIDYVGGIEDLRTRHLRAIGDPAQRFAEDHLRLLRAIRFAARFGLTMEPATAQAIAANAPRLAAISPERIAEELRLMLAPPSRSAAWPLLWKYRLVQVIFRFLPDSSPSSLDSAISLLQAIAPDQAIGLGLALAAAAVDYQKTAAAGDTDLFALADRPAIGRAGRALRKSLRISNEELAQFEGALGPLPMLLGSAPPTIASMKRFLASAHAPAARLLLEALATTGLHTQRICWLKQQFTNLMKADVAPLPLITGDDLTAAGYSPGPAFKRVLEKIYDAQLEGKISDKAAAIALSAQLFAQKV